MRTPYHDSFERNIGIFTKEEQELLRNSTVAVAGVGGVGGMLVERLVRLGIGNIKITDPGTFEKSNFNRQLGSSVRTNGLQKAEVVGEMVQDINPEAKIVYDINGITNQQDAARFVAGADLVLDEMDYGAWKESIYLQRAARKQGIYYCFAGAIGFGALVANFEPNGITLEEYNGLEADQNLEPLQNIVVAIEKVLPVYPSYINTAMDNQMLQEIIAGLRPVPTCAIGVGLASMMAASTAVNIILRRKEIIKAPQYVYLDLLDQLTIIGTV
ncbi:MAG TPA: ThiF family adenylyltransferase [Syntrophomonadaceae bacterium]|nr:ThiF family adenylyltransferase [Syntrophomonadaceae bacterium]